MSTGCSGGFVLEVRGLRKTYAQGQWWQKRKGLRVLDGLDFNLRRASTVALVGPSGCGKTTLAMCLVGLDRPDAGEILLDRQSLFPGQHLSHASQQRQVQLIFQDSAGALNPRMTAAEIVEEPLLLQTQRNALERTEIAEGMMERVGISAKWKHRLPHQFSGGQRQRLGIARALVLRPQVLILDEVFAGLDLSIQNQIANLLLSLQHEEGISLLCISHDFALVSRIADEIALMERGRIVEQTSLEMFFKNGRNPDRVAAMASSRFAKLAMSASAGGH